MPGSSHFTILITQMGGLGDLVLTAGLITPLREYFADATIILVCRAPFVSVCGLFPSQPDQVVPLDFSPYEWGVPSEDFFAALTTARQRTDGLRADLFIAAEYQPTWFSWFLAAQLKPQRAVNATRANRPDALLAAALDHFDCERVEFEGPQSTPDLHEMERYAGIIQFLGGKPGTSAPWIFPESTAAAVQDALRQLDLQTGEYLVCFPLGVPGILVKRWPRATYVRALMLVRQTNPLPILFTGDDSERAELEQFSQALGEDAARVFTGPPSAIPILAGLLLHARAYLGNDTGPMHLASAYGIGGVAIYGGGHWPAYGPWGQGSVAMVHPLPCFGCNWDCLFGHGLCVESIQVEPVVEALNRLLGGEGGESKTITLDTLPAQTNDLIRDANRRYREAELDRSERLSSIIDLRRNVDSSHGRLEELEQTAGERLCALESQHAAIEQLRSESDRRRKGMEELTRLLELRDARIGEIEAIALQRMEALESQAASYGQLKEEADRRYAGLLELTDHVAARDQRILVLEEIAVERYKALQTQARAFAELQTEADRRTAGMVELTALLAERDELIRTLGQIAKERLKALEELTAHIAGQDNVVGHLQRTAEERLVALQNAGTAMESLSAEAEKRREGLEEFCRIVERRDAQIATQQQISEERLAALLATDAELQSVRADAELRLRGMEELTNAIEERDARIANWEKTASERLDALTATDASLQSARKGVAELKEQIAQLEKRLMELETESVALNDESLYTFLVRRMKKQFSKQNPRSR